MQYEITNAREIIMGMAKNIPNTLRGYTEGFEMEEFDCLVFESAAQEWNLYVFTQNENERMNSRRSDNYGMMYLVNITLKPYEERIMESLNGVQRDEYKIPYLLTVSTKRTNARFVGSRYATYNQMYFDTEKAEVTSLKKYSFTVDALKTGKWEFTADRYTGNFGAVTVPSLEIEDDREILCVNVIDYVCKEHYCGFENYGRHPSPVLFKKGSAFDGVRYSYFRGDSHFIAAHEIEPVGFDGNDEALALMSEQYHGFTVIDSVHARWSGFTLATHGFLQRHPIVYNEYRKCEEVRSLR